MIKVAVINSPDEARERLNENQTQGCIMFIYHHADPSHELLSNKFLYIHSDDELAEKVNLLKMDVTVQDLLRQ